MCRVLHIYQQRSGCAMSSRPEMIAPHWVLIFNELPILERQVLNHRICIHRYIVLHLPVEVTRIANRSRISVSGQREHGRSKHWEDDAAPSSCPKLGFIPKYWLTRPRWVLHCCLMPCDHAHLFQDLDSCWSPWGSFSFIGKFTWIMYSHPKKSDIWALREAWWKAIYLWRHPHITHHCSCPWPKAPRGWELSLIHYGLPSIGEERGGHPSKIHPWRKFPSIEV